MQVKVRIIKKYKIVSMTINVYEIIDELATC